MDDALRVEAMTIFRTVLRIAIERFEDWHNDRVFAAWRAQRSSRRRA